MPRSSSAAIAIAVAIAVGAARPAAAAPCREDLALSIVAMRFAVLPSPGADDGLGVEVLGRGPRVAWGDGCAGTRHLVDVSDVEADGDGDAVVAHLVGYRVQWQLGAVRAHVGTRLLTLWAEEPRFVTPVAGLAIEPVPGLLVESEVASAGLFLIAPGDRPTRARRDLSLQIDVAWPVAAATRGELRVRARRHDFARRTIDDVTISAGVGLAWAARDDKRAVPGFLGVAARRGDDGDLRLFAVAELAFGLADR